MTAPEQLRLVKLRLPADLVRSLDQAILRSHGAYLDRNEFVAEAIRDRLIEDADTPASTEADPSRQARPVTEPSAWGAWLSNHVASRTPRPVPGTTFGLHNRDLPTLWSLDAMASDVAQAGGPIPWTEYVSALEERALGVGEALRMADADDPLPLKRSIGFPRAGPKTKASVERFIWASVGDARGRGPMFVLGLATLDGEGITPTGAGLDLLRDLLDLRYDFAVPPGADATMRWWDHMASHAHDELDLFRRTLRCVSPGISRADLVASFTEWPGSQADTNCMGLISRAREWGLVEPKMEHGTYELTDLGRQFLDL